MHLLALLIAAVLSSDFIAVNTDPAEFKITSHQFIRTTDDAVALEFEQIVDGAAWTGTITVIVTKTSTAPTTLTGGAATNEALGVYTTAAIQVKTLLSPAEGDTLYVWVVTNDGGAEALVPGGPATLPITDKWFVTPSAEIDEDTFVIKNLAVTEPATPWGIEAGANRKVTVHLADSVQTTPSTGTWKVEEDSEALVSGSTFNVLEIALQDWLLHDVDEIFVYVSFVDDAGDPQWATGYVTIPVAAAKARFTRTEPADLSVTAANIATLKVTQIAGDANWADTTVSFILARSADADLSLLTPVTATSAAGVHTATAVPLTELGRLYKTDKIYVFVQRTETEGTRILKVPVQITLTGDHEYATFTAAPETVDLRTQQSFTVTVKQNNTGASNGDPWTGNVLVLLTTDKTVQPVHATAGWIAANGDATDGYVTAAQSATTLGLKKNDILYVWVKYGAGNTVLPDPGAIKIIETEPEHEFEVTPITVSLADIKKPFTVKQKDQTEAWPATVTVYFSLAKSETPTALPVKLTATGAGEVGNVAHVTTDLDLTLLTGIAADATIYVYVSYTSTEANTEVVATGWGTVAVTGAFPAFIYTPTTIDLTAANPTITVTQVADAGKWSEKPWFYFSIGASLTPKELEVNAEAIYDATAAPKHVWKLADFNAKLLEGIKDEDVIFLYVATGGTTAATGTIIPNCHGEITVSDTPADPTVFVLDPAAVFWAEGLKLAQTEIKPTPAAPSEWPKQNNTISFRITPPAAPPANDEPAEVTGKVIVLGAAGAEKWYIPAETDISTLVPTELTANVVLKVEIALSGSAWLTQTTTLTVKPEEPEKPEAAMGVSPLLSLLAALVFLFVKLF